MRFYQIQNKNAKLGRKQDSSIDTTRKRRKHMFEATKEKQELIDSCDANAHNVMYEFV